MKSDILIIGAGIAGLYTALKMAPRPVVVVTARPIGEGGASPWAQGGLAAAIGEDDTPNLHFSDTMQAGHAGESAHPPGHNLSPLHVAEFQRHTAQRQGEEADYPQAGQKSSFRFRNI